MSDTGPDGMVVWLRAAMDAAQNDAEAAGGDEWRRQDHPDAVAIYDSKGEPVVYDEGSPTEAQQAHIVRHSPAAVLRRIAADRKLLDDLLAEPHAVLTPGGSTQIYCDADSNLNEFCDCGRDARVERQLRLLAEGWGWTEETT